jgi:hypothetical protein
MTRANSTPFAKPCGVETFKPHPGTRGCSASRLFRGERPGELIGTGANKKTASPDLDGLVHKGVFARVGTTGRGTYYAITRCARR